MAWPPFVATAASQRASAAQPAAGLGGLTGLLHLRDDLGLLLEAARLQDVLVGGSARRPRCAGARLGRTGCPRTCRAWLVRHHDGVLANVRSFTMVPSGVGWFTVICSVVFIRRSVVMYSRRCSVVLLHEGPARCARDEVRAVHVVHDLGEVRLPALLVRLHALGRHVLARETPHVVDTPEIDLMCSSALYDTRSSPQRGSGSAGFSRWLMSSSSTTRAGLAPRCSSSAVDMLVSALRFTFQPELAEVFTTCSSWLETLFSSSCGPSRFSHEPTVRPRRKYGKYGHDREVLVRAPVVVQHTLSAMTVQRMRWISFFVVGGCGLGPGAGRCALRPSRWARRACRRSPDRRSAAPCRASSTGAR